MRNFLDIVNGKLLTEAKNDSTKTRDTSRFDFLNSLETGDKQVAPTSRTRTPAAQIPGTTASGTKTRRKATQAVANTPQHPGAGEAMRNMFSANQEEDEVSDDELRALADFEREWDDDTTATAPGRVEPHLAITDDRPRPTNENLPAIVNKDIALSGDTRVHPEWHQVKHLPGYMLNAIRAGGRKVFREFTDTPLEEIQMICTILNPEIEVRAVMNWVRHNGVPEKEVEMEFGGGVTAKVRLWKTEDFSFLLVQDYMGVYIYAWAGGRGTKLSHQAPKRMGRE